MTLKIIGLFRTHIDTKCRLNLIIVEFETMSKMENCSIADNNIDFSCISDN